MEAVDRGNLVRAYLSTVPEGREVLAAVRSRNPDLYAEWINGEIQDLLEFFLKTLSWPFLLPLLRGGEGDAKALLVKCFSYIEGLSLNDDPYFRSSLEIGVLEQFLEDRDMLLRAYRLSFHSTRGLIRQMLMTEYPESYRRICGQLNVIDGNATGDIERS
jgi:hypothetical protein